MGLTVPVWKISLSINVILLKVEPLTFTLLRLESQHVAFGYNKYLPKKDGFANFGAYIILSPDTFYLYSSNLIHVLSELFYAL